MRPWSQQRPPTSKPSCAGRSVPLFKRVLNADWQRHLSYGVRGLLERTHSIASERRDGVLNDPWLSAGLAEIQAIVGNFGRQHAETAGLEVGSNCEWEGDARDYGR